MNRAEALRTLGRYGARNYLDITPRGFEVVLASFQKSDGISWGDVEPFYRALQYLIRNPPPERRRSRKRTR